MKENRFVIEEILEISTLNRHSMSLSTNNKFCFVLSCRIEGESLFFYKGEKFKLCAGDILYIPQGTTYSQSTDGEKVIYIHMNITGDFGKNISIYRPKTKSEAKSICEAFSNIADIWSKNTDKQYYLALSEIYRLAALKNAIPPSVEKKDTLPKSLFLAVKYIKEHFSETDFCFEKACESAFISRTSFNKTFKNHFGITPHKYLAKLRIGKAKRLLKSNLYTREEIAHLCGFCDVKYFYTFFKSQTGITTNKYLQSLNKTPDR